ncbi:hypothetical protein CHLRE_03g210513v5 [Chlamydomonas reinhardtii]|uniref:NADH:flavin oxidoreductase/NADH oxidase N-terminal domain-containing protein n=1 Tax=Chlamydomonas reinhardtii TaxID=3055 RepID=A8JBW0_CHLRE|nr:uncharacterized protein CHLRE_03g210513v5 [Chlamydomonas reinhardtii]PNW86066.1 hypothetical protein CHLRE_03g210513v5 [Chlamydomonas reinhardtii]|eukprot:XP_001699408.1 predicted protein [Chlamydomonas reinhardtii]
MQSARVVAATHKVAAKHGSNMVCRSAAAVSTAPAQTVAPPTSFDLGDGSAPVPVPAAVAPLFAPLTLTGAPKKTAFQLTNRIVYAPLTRCRAVGNLQPPQAAEYYSQRTVPGTLLITEATNITAEGLGYLNTPGLYTPEQLESWKPVTKAVHDKGGVFFCQLWHTGRVSHSDLQPGNQLPISSSSTTRIAAEGYQVYTPSGPKPHEHPRAATREDIKRIVKEYAAAAVAAVEVAGFDGVEIHAANGYLIDQFLKDNVNDRTDEYGGSIENRCRFALEVTEAVVAAVGADRVGIRLSPFITFNDVADSMPYGTNVYLLEQLNKLGLAYVHMVEPRIDGITECATVDTLAPFRSVWKGTFIVAGGYKAENGAPAVANGHADLVAYGRWYLANPDFHKRILLGAPLNPYNRDTFYGGGLEGYTDYPTLEQLKEKAAQQ